MAYSKDERATQRNFFRAASGVITATALAATLLTPVTAQAQRREPPLLVSYPTDATMTCDQLSAEIVRVAEIAGIAAENAQNATSQGQMADAAAGVAVNAALYSGALGAVPGLGMFANAAGGMARRNAEARARAEAERVRVAEQRHTLLTGIYQGRQCGMAPAPVVAVATSPAGVEAVASRGAETVTAEPQTMVTSSSTTADD